MATVVALIRGINLGAVNRISMPELRALLEEAGFSNVRTHLQSGNVVLDAGSGPAAVARAVEKEIAARLGLEVDVVARSAKEIAAVVAANPLGEVATDPKRYYVSFLSGTPKAAVLREIAKEDFSPERFEARGRELYIWCPDGMRNSRVVKALSEKRLGVTATMRNWNTVAAVHELAQA